MIRLFFLIVLQALVAPVFSQHEGHSPAGQKPDQHKEQYSCPMHPEMHSDQPGRCPKCGMSLAKSKTGGEVTVPDPAHADHPNSEIPAPAFSGKVNVTPGKTVRYDLYVTDTMVNYTGKQKHAFAVNGTLPGPELVFTEGDTAAIYVHNLAKAETSVHWHGVILPNEFDGVPFLTTQPIHTGETHLYKFAVQQNGTYWYHSHSGLQEQAGVYGALIFKERPEQEPIEKSPHHQHITSMDDQAITMHQQERADTTGADQHAGHEMAKTVSDPGMSGMNHVNHMQMPAMPLKGDGSYNKEQTIVLSEWTDEKPSQVQRRLRTVNDWYAIKKGSTQSYSEAIGAGHFGTKVTNEWKRMNAMDVSDVYYDRFLINGKPVGQAPEFQAGDRVRLRIINAGGSSYFWVGYGGGKMTVIANDGNDVEPVEVDRLIVGVSETYDVVVAIPGDMSYEFRATPEDRTKVASLWLGSGMKMPAPQLPRLKYFEGMKMMNDMMAMNGDMKSMGMEMSLQQMDMNMVMYDELNDPPAQHHHSTPEQTSNTEAANMIEMQGIDRKYDGITTLNYAMLKSPTKTILPDAPYKTLEFELTGNMNRYVWSINNKVVREWDKIMIEKGQNVRIILFNNSMMRHPMHLHGHDFRVVNGQGDYAPFKNVLDIMPMERDTIEFAGSQSGDWFFHCHILYHMMAGMGNVFSYRNSPPNPELPDATAAYNKFLRSENMFHIMAEVGLESNGSDGMIMIPSERFELRSEWRLGLHARHGYESETYLGRYVGKMQWWFPFVGFDYHKNNRDNSLEKNAFGQRTNQNNRQAFVAGIEYTLPMLVTAQARIDSKGKFRFQLGREDIPLTPRLRLSAMWNTDREYMAGLKYILRKGLALSTHYDSDMAFGAGITIVY